MKIEEAEKYIKMMLRDKDISDAVKAMGYVYGKEAIETLLAELQKKDKIIDLMALDIHGMQIECNRYFKDIEEVKQYFEKKVEGE